MKRKFGQMEDSVKLMVWVPSEMLDQVKKAAKADERSISSWVRRAIDAELKPRWPAKVLREARKRGWHADDLDKTIDGDVLLGHQILLELS